MKRIVINSENNIIDVCKATALEGVIAVDETGFVGIVAFNNRSQYQIIDSNGVIGKEYSTLRQLMESNTLYEFYQLEL